MSHHLTDRPARSMHQAPRRPTLPAALVAALLCILLLVPAAIAQESTPSALTGSAAISPIAAASAWLRAQQDPSGGFAGLSAETDPGTTADAAIALYAAQASDPEAAAALAAAITYLEAEGAAYAATGPGQAAKLAQAAIAGGRDPRAFAGMDLVAAMTAPLATPEPAGVAGLYGDDLYDHALVLIALAAAGEEIAGEALRPLRDAQGDDGGWAFDGSSAPGAADSNTTALVIQALAATGYGDDPMVEGALAFLRSLQAPDSGGYAYGPADPLVADANSTALVIQALRAAGEDPTSREWGDAPLALARFQTSDGGLRYLATDEAPNLLATLQGIPALADLALPVATICPSGDNPESDACVTLTPAA